VVKLHLIRNRSSVVGSEIIERSENIVRRYILKSKDDKMCKIPCYLLGNNGRASHIVNALREVVYSRGENGNQEVKYNPREEINISLKALRILKDNFRD